MFLVARLFGVGAYALFTVLCAFSMRKASTKGAKRILNVYCLLLIVMAYFFVPNTTADLYRLTNAMHYFTTLSWKDLGLQMIKTDHPGAVLYFYGIGLLHNDHLLPAISASIDLFFISSIIKSELKQPENDKIDAGLSLFILMSSGVLMSMISGIRNTMAYCIIVWCIYRECRLSKSFAWHIPLYLIAGSIHSMGMAVFLYRIVILLLERRDEKGKNNRFSKFIALSIFGVFIFYDQTVIQILFQKATGYFYAEEGSSAAYFYIWNLVLSILIVLGTMYLLHEIKCQKNIHCGYISSIVGIDKFISFVKPICYVSPILIFVQYSFFTRTVSLLHLLCLPLSMILFAETDELDRKRVTSNILIIYSVIFILACARGDICSLKFW